MVGYRTTFGSSASNGMSKHRTWGKSKGVGVKISMLGPSPCGRRLWHATQDCNHILHRDRFWAIHYFRQCEII